MKSRQPDRCGPGRMVRTDNGGGNPGSSTATLIVKGQSHLLDEVSAVQDLERVEDFSKLETEEHW